MKGYLMHSRSTFSFLAIMIFLGCTVRASAAQETNPQGSYQQTCSNVSVKKGTLYAMCQDAEGKSHSTKLSHYEKCSDIANKNGKLECAGGAEATAPALPAGSYTDSCENVQMKGTTLHAVCKNQDGREMPTSLKDANRCTDGVANVNGILNCAVSGVLPPGSYIATCKDIQLLETTLYATCQEGKGGWRNTGLRDVQKCNGDIANQNGKLRCMPLRNMEKR
jgi:hypothetical protein